MLKRELSGQKLPKLPPPGDSTLSSKLYSLTGLRIFQAKFMDDLRHPRPKPNIASSQNANENGQIGAGKLVLGQGEGFSGKDRANEGRVGREGESRVRE
jgi:hypothetical protein